LYAGQPAFATGSSACGAWKTERGNNYFTREAQDGENNLQVEAKKFNQPMDK
jgi:hypothetical protein